MSQSQVVQVTLDASGQTLKLLNALLATTSLEIDYTINGSPATIKLVLAGGKNDGSSDTLDTYTVVANAARTVVLAKTYDFFLLTATWTGGGSVTVAATLKTSGAGAAFAGAFQFVQSGVGSPAGVLAAPVGTVYVDLSGGAGTTLYVKESGGSTSSGWVA